LGSHEKDKQTKNHLLVATTASDIIQNTIMAESSISTSSGKFELEVCTNENESILRITRTDKLYHTWLLDVSNRDVLKATQNSYSSIDHLKQVLDIGLRNSDPDCKITLEGEFKS
jgi:hypothetical protein